MVRVIIHHADRRRHRSTTSKLVRRCQQVQVPQTAATKLRYGQAATVTGLLETVDGTPVPNAPIQASGQASGWAPKPAGSLSTNSQGRFTYKIAAGPSRTVTFSYPGTPILRSAATSTDVTVKGKATMTITPKRAIAGQPLWMSGRVYGGYIPPDGLLVQIWFSIQGLVSPQPFRGAIYTNSHGYWKVKFPLAQRAKGFTYRFYVVVAKQGDWPFAATTSNQATRHIY